ncbi:UDP-galactopyranose mutase [Pararcticibacter amylolyticus]|uniref:UDP-galactopyranose mutase n=1 Tax=Pararcticibacter amylolyticus TaxID=2173175 RepID=A0A2U2P9T2_9SPHI|nr:UDP-galactopyranose mutase [Pararcticibacter amylolyticus]PWG78158.1 UDP-galactopyranose mutase [Pararcticibacter amylolyticus]
MGKHKYDYLLVGAGLFNAVFAREASKQGKKCLVIEKRGHIGGNLYCENIEGINVHKYGAHIFHTSNKHVWDYMNELCEFNHYINSPLANYKNKLYNLPFNMNTFNRLWGLNTPEQVKQKIEEQRLKIDNPANFEEQALSLIGTDVYQKLIKGYTEKQWGQDAKSLPAFIIKRIPIRFTYNNNYFNDPYQGIPIGGYNSIFEKCFEGCDIYANTDFFANKEIVKSANKTVFTGMIDQYYDYCYGQLDYRSLNFEHEVMNVDNFQGNAVINYTEREVPFTRILEHKHFEFGTQPKTVVTKEYSQEWRVGLEPYYPINTAENQEKFVKYEILANQQKNIYFGGRLGEYKYYDMDKTVEAALSLFKKMNGSHAYR